MGPKILVTGGAGYIGSHVVRQLSEAGEEVVVYDNLTTGAADALIHGERLIVGDLADREKLNRVMQEIGCKSVLHFAAAIVPQESVQLPLKYYSNNTINTLSLLQACVNHGVERFIFSSSAAVYGMPEGGVAGEANATTPINPYGTSKLMSEMMLRDVSHAHGISYVVLRYFNVSGADPLGRMGQRTPEATHLIKVACQAALGIRDGISIFGSDYDTPDGTGVRDYIHVEDLASVHLRSLTYLKNGGASTTMNAGYGKGNTVRKVIEVVKKISGIDFPVVEGPRRPGDPAHLVANADKIKSTLGWSPSYDDLDTIVSDALRWERSLAMTKQ